MFPIRCLLSFGGSLELQHLFGVLLCAINIVKNIIQSWHIIGGRHKFGKNDESQGGGSSILYRRTRSRGGSRGQGDDT
ncbi:hypothetical protein H5410_015378 [Solanum commersonii]|uniref:Uncharacterized protein n=1 Tax=Solanum commersonii TaxID=4109 RepID=A0A9J5ZU71_SOLCO|nr:hypothetical protein H5410_015378 [Solanum commersonii]